MKIAIVAGTRPEVIKLAPVHGALLAHGAFDSVWVSTEQQAPMTGNALATMRVSPDMRLTPPSPERSLGGRFAEMMGRLDDAFEVLSPDMVLVQGDTSTTAAGAMAAFARRIPVAHVEAGLRTFDLDNPFPEEGWRRVVGQLAAVHFAPTALAADNLARSGIAADKVHVTGNTGIDSVRITGDGIVPEPLIGGRRRVLITLHRRENWEAALDQILAALLRIRDQIEDAEFVFVAHANPMLRGRILSYLRNQPRIRVVGPLDYVSFIAHLKSASLVMSDSGGVQEEAPVFGTPVLVLRDTTERPEGIDAGVAKLVGSATDAVTAAAVHLLTHEAERMAMVRAVSPFGDGFASERIVDVLAARAARAETTAPALAAG